MSANKPTSQQANKPTSQQANKPTSQQAIFNKVDWSFVRSWEHIFQFSVGEETDNFFYHLSKINSYRVISFYGPLNERASYQLIDCYKRISSINDQYFIFNFREVTSVDKKSFLELAQLTALVRSEKKALLRGCGIDELLIPRFLDCRIFLESEILGKMSLAIRSFNKMKKEV